jgi:hypothetical protein
MVSTTDEKNIDCLNLAHEAPVTKKRLLAVERMRRHRERRREGLRSYRIDLREAEVDELIRRGLLKSENRHEHDWVVAAFHEFLDQVFA